MIKAEIFYKDQDIWGVTIQGHAGMRDCGEFDLICASVSAISQTALLGLDKHLIVKPKWQIEDDGYLDCWLPKGLMGNELIQAQAILSTLVLGLLSIEESYGQYLKVSKRRWTNAVSD